MSAQNPTIAYLSLEFGIDERLAMYAGGLGILAGDVILQAQENNLSFIGVGLSYDLSAEKLQTAGFFLLPERVSVEIGNEEITLGVWKKQFGSAALLLLDLGTNAGKLYDLDRPAFLRQQLCLGIGAVRMLEELNILVDIYHLNEGHCAMAVLELSRQKRNTKIVATKHTIFSGAGLYLTKEEFSQCLALYFKKYSLDGEEIFYSGTHAKHPEKFSTTKYLLSHAHKVSGVSNLHVTFEKQTHAESTLIAITNGVFQKRWQIPQFCVNDIDNLTDSQIWTYHLKHKQILLDTVKDKTAIKLDRGKLTVVWARRLVDYKRPGLIFNDIERLTKIITNITLPVQFIIAGRVNPGTEEGDTILALINSALNKVELKGNIVLWPNYDINVARVLVSGADVWLNTPKVGFEACGTSGMKAGLNGVLQFSVADGWYPEVSWQEAGWVLPEVTITKSIYEILESDIVPTFYDQDRMGLPTKWVSRMRKTIEIIQKNYTTKRMLKDYEEKLYH